MDQQLLAQRRNIATVTSATNNYAYLSDRAVAKRMHQCA